MNRYTCLCLLWLSCLLGLAQNLPTPPAGYRWSDNMVKNANLAGDDLSSFACGGDATMRIITKDGNRVLEVISQDFRENEWDSQFFLCLGEKLEVSDQYYISFSCKAERQAVCHTEAQCDPGVYNHWEMLGDLNISTSWNSYTWSETVTSDQAGISTGNDGLGVIAFNLCTNQQNANSFYFRDFDVRRLIPEESVNNDVLCINEIQVANNDLFLDPSLNYGGWMELYNGSNASVSLGRYYVSDEEGNLKKFRLTTTAGTVPAHGFAVIWFDHNSADGSYSNNAQNQVRFKLDMEGGTIYLSDAQGQLVECITYPPATPRCSYARTKDGGATWATTGMPTPNQSNNSSYFATERLEAPLVSRDGGVFEMGTKVNFKVTIPAGATLHYTTDGSTPTATHGSKSTTGSFTVSQTTIYRFCLTRDDRLPSPVITRSFIFKNHEYYLPVLSIGTLEDNLFSNKTGIYVRGTNGISGRGQDTPCNWNRDWERPVNMEFLVPQQNSEGNVEYIAMLNQEVSMEIMGGWSRGFHGGVTDGHTWEAKSSFRLKTSKCYDGQNELPYAVFPNKPYNKYKAWQVRNGGNDELHRAKDAILQQTVITSGFDIDCQDYQPCHVFFNGLYVGMLNIRECSNKQYGYSNFGIDTDDTDQFENWGDFKAGDNVAWKELRSRATRLSSSHSANDYASVCELLDVDEFVNYMAVECYLGGSDWLTPTYSNNLKAYRSRNDQGKFRFVMFDLDGAFDDDDFSMFNKIADGTIGGDEVGKLFRSMIQYEDFRRQFLDAMCIIEGSIMEPIRAGETASRICDMTRTALSFEGLEAADEVTPLLDKRYKGSVVDNLAGHKLYNLDNPYWLKLSSNIEAGQLMVNGQRVPTGKLDGRMYDFKSQGIQLTAQAQAGYRFLGWNREAEKEIKTTLIGKTTKWDYYDRGSLDGQDWKATDYDAAAHGWKTGYNAPFGYGNSGSYSQNNANTKLDYGGNANNKRPTYYFRTTFYVDTPTAEDDIYKLNYQIDDGFAIYINGRFVEGFRMSESDSRYDFVTTDYAGGTPDQGTILISPEHIRQGWNTLAVEVHNNSLTSSDIFWDCNLQRTAYNNDTSAPTLFSTSPTLQLTEHPAGAYTLVATYERITDTRQRYETGGTPIRINEVSAGNDIYINDYHKKNDWVELYNTTDEDIDLSGLYLSDIAKKPQKWMISSSVANTIIPAHSTRIVWCDNLEPISQLHAPFKLDNADGASVSIQAADGSWADQLTYLAQPRWQTYGRYPDGGNFSALLSLPTIDRSNHFGTMNMSLYDTSNDPESAITLELAGGWNWTSHNMGSDIDFSRFASYALEAYSQTKQRILDGNHEWQGTLDHFSPAKGYKLRMKQETEVTLRGMLYDTTLPFPLAQGWNWIGVPLKNATALDAALAHFTPSEGDLLVGMEGFALYEDGTWNGSLTKLDPGQAYCFKVGQSQELKWNDLSLETRVRERRYAAARLEKTTPWTLDIHAHPNIMTMVAKVEAQELDLQRGYSVGAFCGNECRGVAQLDNDVIYMNIHGEGDEEIHFRLLDGLGDTYVSQEKTEMHDLHCMGSFKTPYLIHFGNHGIEDVIQPTLATQRIISVEYYNLSGQRISQPQGICVKRTTMSDGSVQTSKIRILN